MSQHQQPKAVTLALSKINIDGGTQSRVALNEDVVADYAEVIRRGGTLPPVVVFNDGGSYWLADGFHRYHAHRVARAEDIDADVFTGTKRDAVLHSVGANANHGLRRSNEDKRRAVQTLLGDAEWSQWSDRQIAEACGVSHPFVAAVRQPEAVERQQANRQASAARRADPVESDSTPPSGNPPTTSEAGESQSSVQAPAPARVPVAKPGGLIDDDVPSLESLLDDAHATNLQLIEQLKAAEADDQVAETLKWRQAYEGSKAEREHAERRARDSEKREKASVARLRRCGKAVGDDDPRSIPGKVEAVVKAAKGAGVWE